MEDGIEVDDLVEDFFKDDEDEHIFLDSILADIGTIPLEVEEASDWERAAHDTLEEFMDVEGAKTELEVMVDILETSSNLEKEVCRQHLVFE